MTRTSHRRLTRLAASLVLASCGTDAGDDPLRSADAGPPPDAAVCRDAGVLELGACRLTEGQTCQGRAGEERHFETLPEGGAMTIVLGPQGSTMFVFSARTAGIVPGDPAQPASPDNPLIEIQVFDDQAALVARYRGRAAFATDPGVGGLTATGLFVVVDGPASAFIGRRLRAIATLTDRDHAVRCGGASFVAEN